MAVGRIMKRLLGGLLLLMPMMFLAQTPAPVTTSGVISTAGGDCSLATSCVTLPISPNHGTVTAQASGTIGTIQFESTTDSNGWTAVLGAPIAGGTGASSATASGIWQFNTAGMAALRVRASACSACSVIVTLTGAAGVPDDASISLGVGSSPLPSGITADYGGTLSIIALLTTTANTSITANTVFVGQLSCYNMTAGAVTLNRTDTAGTKFETSFSIPANSNYLRSYTMPEKMVGVQMWAGTASALNCTLTAKQ